MVWHDMATTKTTALAATSVRHLQLKKHQPSTDMKNLFPILIELVFFSLAQVEVDLMGVEEVADPPWCCHDAVNALPLDGVDLASLVLTTLAQKQQQQRQGQQKRDK